MTRRLLSTTALAGLMFFAATPAYAACSNNNPVNNATVTCNDADATGIFAPGSNNVTVNVGAAGSINPGPGSVGIRLDDGAIVNVAAGGVVNGNTNDAMTLGDNANVTLNGSATGSSEGIQMDANGTVSISSTGSLQGNTGAFFTSGDGDLTVYGSLTGTGGSAAIFNAATDATVIIGSAATITGNILAGAGGSDEFHFDATTSTNLSTNDFGGASKYRNFELFFKEGAGTTTLTGNNALNWTISAGTLSADLTTQMGNASIGASGTLEFNTMNGNYSNNASGTGTWTITDGSIMTLGGNNSGFTGQMNIDINNNVTVGSQNALSNAAEVYINQSTLTYAGSFTATNAFEIGANDATFDTGANNVTMSGNIIGATGKLVKAGSGTLTLSGTNTFGDGIYFDDGAIAAAAATNLGSGNFEFNGGALTYLASYNLTRNSALTGNAVFNTGGFDSIITGDVSGSGILQKNNAGTLTLLGDHSHTGDIIINAGTLVLDDATNRTYAGEISGGGNFTKEGAGTLTLTGDSTNLTGFTFINEGLLVVNADYNNTWTIVQVGGSLGGTGTLEVLENFGTVAPGNSIGTLNVDNLLTFENGSTYDVEINDVGAGQSDLIIAGGAITINNGSTLRLSNFGGANAYNNGPYTYTILQGASVTGTFTTIDNTFAFLDETMIYNAASVQVQMARNDINFSEVAQDEDQADVADAVEDLGAGNDVYDAFTGLTDAQARDALDDLSGEHNAGLTGVMAESAGMVQSTILSHIAGLNHANAPDDKSALAPSNEDGLYVAALLEPSSGSASPSQFWLQGIGSIGQSDSYKTAPQQDRHSYGLLGGIDVPFDDVGTWGLFGGYERGEVETDSQSASSNLDNYHVGLYATRPMDNDFTLSGGLGATYHDIDTVRYVVFPGFSGAPEGDTKGFTASGFVEVAKATQLDGVAVEPFANVSLTHSHMDGYTETGGNGAELVVDSTSKTTPSTQIGIRSGKSVQVDDTTLNISGSIAWQHNFGELDNESTMRFAAGATSFESNGPARTRDAAVVGIGVNASIGAGAQAYAGYNGTLSSRAQDHGFKAGLKWDF